MARTTLLIIDGDDDLSHSLAAQAEARGFAVLAASTSTAGLELAREHRPDLVVISVELSPTNGWSVCTRLRKDEELQHIPIILTSATSTSDTFEKHSRLKTRANEYVHKPYDPEELLNMCDGLLGLQQGEESGEELIVEDETLSLGDFDGADDADPFSELDDEPLDLVADGADATGGNPVDSLGDAGGDPLGAPSEFGDGTDDPLDMLHSDDVELSELEVLEDDELEMQSEEAESFGESNEPQDGLAGHDSQLANAGSANVDPLASVQGFEDLAFDPSPESDDSELSYSEESLSVEDLSSLDAPSGGGGDAAFPSGGFTDDELASLEAAAGADDAGEEFVDGDDLQVFDEAFDQLADEGTGQTATEGSDQAPAAHHDQDLHEGDQHFVGDGSHDPLGDFGEHGDADFDPAALSPSPAGDGEQEAPELLSMTDVSEVSEASLGHESVEFDSEGDEAVSFDDAEAFGDSDAFGSADAFDGTEAFDAGSTFEDDGAQANQGAQDQQVEWDDGSAQAFDSDGFGEGYSDDPFADDAFGAEGFDSGGDGSGEHASADIDGGLGEAGANEFGSEELEFEEQGASADAEGASDSYQAAESFGEGDEFQSFDDFDDAGAGQDFAGDSDFQSFQDGGDGNASLSAAHNDSSTVEALEGRIAELEAELEGYREAESGRAQEVERLNGELRARDGELLESRNQQLEKDRLIHELRESESRLNAELAKARDDRARREATVKALSAKAEQMATQARRLEQEVTRARDAFEQLNALEAQCAELNERVEALTAERDTIAAQVEAAEAKTAELEEKLSRARESILGALG